MEVFKISIDHGTMKELIFFSKELGEDVNVLVYLPVTYTPLIKNHLFIAQDGRDYFQLGRIGRIVDELLTNHEIENCIIVGVPYKDIKDRREKYYPNSEKQKKYIRFLAHELVSLLDREYPTYQIASSRTLMGDSLAGTVSLMAALQYPYTFGNVIMHSPFVNQDVLKDTETTTSNELCIYHMIGLQETNVKTTDGLTKDFLTPNRQLSTIIKRKGFPYFYEEFNGDHTWKYWQPDLKRALKYIFQ